MGVQNLGDALVFVNTQRQAAAGDEPWITGQSLAGFHIVEVDHLDTVISGELPQHRRFTDRTGAVQRNHRFFVDQLREEFADPSLHHVVARHDVTLTARLAQLLEHERVYDSFVIAYRTRI